MFYKTLDDVLGFLMKTHDTVADQPISMARNLLNEAGSALNSHGVVGITYNAHTNGDHSSLNTLLTISRADGGYEVTERVRREGVDD